MDSCDVDGWMMVSRVVSVESEWRGRLGSWWGRGRGIAGLWMDDAYGLGSKGERGKFRGETKFFFWREISAYKDIGRSMISRPAYVRLSAEL